MKIACNYSNLEEISVRNKLKRKQKWQNKNLSVAHLTGTLINMHASQTEMTSKNHFQPVHFEMFNHIIFLQSNLS